MNRRQFLTLLSTAPLLTAAIPLDRACAQPNQPRTDPHIASPVWLRGTYTGWPKPGVPL